MFNIVVFSSSSFSIPLLNRLVAAKKFNIYIITTPDQKKGRGQKKILNEIKLFAEEQKFICIAPERLKTPEVLEQVKSFQPDFMMIASYGKLIPSSLFSLSKYGGASPVKAAILNGDIETGVSIAEVTDRLDAGDIFAQEKTPIARDEYCEDLMNRLAHVGANLAIQTIENLTKGNLFKTPQNEAASSYAKKIEKDDGLIDWKCPAEMIYNQIRAYYPWPSAFTFLNGIRLKILEAKVCNDSSDATRTKTGTMTVKNKPPHLFVQTGDGSIEIVHLQPEGKTPITAVDFLNGYRLNTGDHLG